MTLLVIRERMITEPLTLRLKFARAALWTELALPLIATLFFVFDRWVSQALFAVGYDNSGLWFVRRQSEFLLSTFPTVEFKSYDFYVFDFFVWLAIGVGCLRIVSGLFSVSLFDARAVWGDRPLWLWLFFPFVAYYGIYAPLVGTEIIIGPSSLRHLLLYSPRAFFGFEAAFFALCAIVYGEGLAFLLVFAIQARAVKS